MRTYITIDIGGTAIKYGVLREDERFLVQRETPTLAATRRGPGIVRHVRECIAPLVQEYRPAGIAVSTAGMVDPERGEIFYSAPLIPDWAGTPLKALLEEAFQLPCEVENDVNCAGLAESRSGAGKGKNFCLCLTIGTGIGGCLVSDGQIYHGAGNSALEVGYLKLPGGDFQDLASTKALVERVERALRADGDAARQAASMAAAGGDAARQADAMATADGYAARLAGAAIPENGALPPLPAGGLNGKIIFDRAIKGDALCVRAIDEMAETLGLGIANLCYVLNPDAVILGGGVMAQEAYLRPRIEAALGRSLLPHIAARTALLFAAYRNEAGMLGAFYHFQDKQEKPNL